MDPSIFPPADILESSSGFRTEDGRIRGCIDAGDGGIIKGWVINENEPDRPLIVEIYEGEDRLASGTADKLRSDVATAGFGSGFSGFEIAVPHSLFDGLTHSFEARAVFDGDTWISIGQIEISLPASTATFGISEDIFPVMQTREIASENRGEIYEEPEGALDQIRDAYVEDMLAGALARIDELESSERNLMDERDLLHHQIAALNSHVGRELRAYSAAPHRFAPGQFDGAGVKTTNITRRRDAWLNHLSRHGLSGPVFALGPHDGQQGPLNILICGSGGIGDALYLSTVIREMALLFPSAALFVLHENSRAGEVLRTNPYLSGTFSLEGSPMQSFIRGCHEFDVFDLIADVRYAVTYSTPPLSRMPFDFVRDASYRSAEWQRYVRFRWPHLNNLFAEEVIRRGMAKLDLVGWTSMLPIRKSSEIDFFFDFNDTDWFVALRACRYVTVHHGADPKMVGQSGLQTKNLPIRIWAETIRRLKRDGFKIVQIGEAREELIAGVDIDLRGRTALDQTAYVLKGASVHLDSEGGLVHLARSVNTPSVVAFGPTPVDFFGYPQNANLGPQVCGGCWWTTESWSQECPRGLMEPECMSTHSPKILASEAVRLAKTAERSFEIVGIASIPEAGELAAIDKHLSMVADNAGRGAFALEPGRTVEQIEELHAVPGEAAVYVRGTLLRAAQSALRHLGQVRALSTGNVPINSDCLDWAVVTGLGVGVGDNDAVSSIFDFGRALRPSGVQFCIIDTDEFTGTANKLLKRLTDDSEKHPGGRYKLKAAPGLKIKPSEAVGHIFLLEIRTASPEAVQIQAKGQGIIVAEPASKAGSPAASEPGAANARRIIKAAEVDQPNSPKVIGKVRFTRNRAVSARKSTKP